MTDNASLPTLLHIEVSQDTRAQVRQLLSGRFELLEASDPLAAFELLQNKQPDMLLLGIHLPHLTGFELAAWLKNRLPHTPLVMLSSEQSADARERALALGCAGFIHKPIDEASFATQVQAFYDGKQAALAQPEAQLRAAMAEMAEHLQIKSRELLSATNRNRHLQLQNQEIINILIRRQSMLEAGARVSHGITSILELGDLLRAAVDIICNEFELYYSGIFLLTENGQTLELRAAAGGDEAGKRMHELHFSLPVDQHSMVGSATLEKKARIALDVEGEPSRFNNPNLPKTRSEMALPLMFKDVVVGALTVQSMELNAFNEEDINALQALADQIAIAIHNAQLLRRLEAANQELLRSKTFEAIATATGEAIHWVGNKAAPVSGSVRRVREDLLNLIAAFEHILMVKKAPGSPLLGLAESIFEQAAAADLQLPALASQLLQIPEKRRNALISLESILEDLQIIENSAETILNIKEDLIGPARQRSPGLFALHHELERIVTNMALPKEVVVCAWDDQPWQVYADSRQVDQVFNNLIKNAWEALDGAADGRIQLTLKNEEGAVLACVRDNGPGMSAAMLEKIWVSFYTTKGDKGGTGLGLPACLEITRQNGGKIWVESEAGQGTAFFVRLPTSA